MKDTEAMGGPRVLAIIARRAISPAKAAISLAPDLTVKVAISLAKAATNRERAAISLVHVTTAKEAISQERAATNRERAAISQGMVISLVLATIARAARDTPPKGEPEGASVPVQQATTLMPSIA